MTGPPLLVYDAECDFCVAWVSRWGRFTGDRVAYAPYQQVARDHPEVAIERFREAVHLRAPDGTWSRGAEAVYRSLAAVPGHGGWLGLYLRSRAFARASDWGYQMVARNRRLLGRLTGVRPGG